MRGLAVLTVAFVFASSALFVGSASAQGTGSLDGTVCVNAYASYGYGSDPAAPCNGSRGLPDATVTLSRAGTVPVGPAPLGPTETSATTDANGAFSFSSLATGDYTFTVTRAGFKDATGSVTVAAGSRFDQVLTGSTVDAKGKITDPDGAAVAQAALNLCCGETGSAYTTSGSDGRYTVAVQAGYWSIDVQAPGFQTTSQQLLVDGSDINFELVRIPPQDGRLTGLVHDQDGTPVADARVALYSYGDCCYAYPMEASSDAASSSRPSYGGENYTVTDGQGRFTMGAYPGENGLSVSKDGYAYHSRSVSIAKGPATSVDVELMKYPAKTARIEGTVVDAKTGKGVPNVYVNLQSPEYGISECSASSSAGGGSSGSSGSGETKVGMSVAPESDPAYQGCAIQTDSEGNFDGMVTPGYGILSVYADWSSSCSESRDADGTTRGECGPEYYSWSSSRLLAANATTTFDVRLRSRPAPDAEVSGYVVDAESGKAIAGAQISFSNQDTYGWGSATTDADGSYRLRLRSGYHSVSVWAEGHLRWEGVVDIAKGDTPFDVEVQPGTESYGGYYGPYYGGGGVAYAMAEDSSAKSSGGAPASASPMGSSDGSSDDQYQDLGGGLGPYDANERSKQLDSPSGGAPGVGLVAMLAALGAVLALRRRRA
ncbi:MAG: carboxypeptidase regulatory-like domain-containing protein [Candidatus Thermoplasmatota archaeon]